MCSFWNSLKQVTIFTLWQLFFLILFLCFVTFLQQSLITIRHKNFMYIFWKLFFFLLIWKHLVGSYSLCAFWSSHETQKFWHFLGMVCDYDSRVSAPSGILSLVGIQRHHLFENSRTFLGLCPHYLYSTAARQQMKLYNDSSIWHFSVCFFLFHFSFVVLIWYFCVSDFDMYNHRYHILIFHLPAFISFFILLCFVDLLLYQHLFFFFGHCLMTT